MKIKNSQVSTVGQLFVWLFDTWPIAGMWHAWSCVRPMFASVLIFSTTNQTLKHPSLSNETFQLSTLDWMTWMAWRTASTKSVMNRCIKWDYDGPYNCLAASQNWNWSTSFRVQRARMMLMRSRGQYLLMLLNVNSVATATICEKRMTNKQK